MDSSTHHHLNFPKLESEPFEFENFNFETQFGNALKRPVFDVESCFDNLNNYNFNSSFEMPSKTTYTDQFLDFKDLIDEFALFDNNSSTCATLPSPNEDMLVDTKPKPVVKTEVDSFELYCTGNVTTTYIDDGNSSNGLALTVKREYGEVSDGEIRSICGRKRTTPLELEEIQKFFNFPISQAAKELNVGLTVLKKRCRELKIMRWPHRKIKSLKALIDNVKELGLTDEILMLEEHKKMLEKLPDMELTERTKRLRQACFKANYKKRRSLAICC
ncbi:Plant regulator RWP-RK [Corchorus olitorius]|uniref:Plant regulator RWP-RK n=1 Tax=Corchorus olitorius TaxID=93759 RepID=A0A1R3JFK7_9ROSI|nr:Plant regulator RWP-RK [Corchorus olitorius]